MEYAMRKELINTEDNPECYLCGSHGKTLYSDCEDHLFGTSGNWGFKQCSNLDCGLIWLDPRPIKSEISKYYQNYYTHNKKVNNVFKNNIFLKIMKVVRRTSYDGYMALKYKPMKRVSILKKLMGLMIYFIPTHKERLNSRAMYMQVKFGGRLLDVGCGNGEKMHHLQELGWKVEGIDLDPKAVSVATNRGMTAYVGNLKEHGYPDQKFHAIVSSHVIEHVYDPIELLRECKRILRPNGKIVIITPNTNSWGRTWFGSSWRGLEPPRHLHIFNSTALSRVAEEAGLRVCTLTSTLRGSVGIFRASYANQSHIRGRRSWGERSWSRVMQLVEWFLIQSGRGRGEELVIVLKKMDNTITT